MEAYAHWGRDLARHLHGDYAFALWDDAKQSLLCVRDALGACPLFFHLDSTVFVFATELQAVLAHPHVSSRIDEGMIAESLSGHVSSRAPTLFRDVRRLPPGHFATITKNQARRRPWWRPHGRRAQFTKPGLWYDAFRETFDAAVSDRLRDASTIGVHLSGGFDSTAVLVTALAQARPGLRIEALSNTYPGRACDETKFIHAVADTTNVHVTTVPETTYEGAWFRGAGDAGTEPWPHPGDYDSFHLRSAAIERDIPVVLTGYGGDETTGATSVQLAECAYRGRWHDVVAHLSQRPRRELGGWLRSAFRDLLPPDLIARLRGESNPVPPWIRSCWARDVGLADRLRPHGRRSPGKAELFETLIGGWNLESNEGEEQAAARQGIIQRDPFLDRRIVELALAAPEWVRTEPGESRPWLTHALGRRLPEVIRRRRDKAAFDHMYVEALRAIGALETWPDLELAARGWIDGDAVRAMHNHFQTVYEQEGRVHENASTLWSILSIEDWLRRVDCN